MEPAAKATGTLFIVSAPSGAGKNTLCSRLLVQFPDLDYSISYTTRSPRSDETDGKDYHFISREAFFKKKAHGHWAEWARVHDHYYATSAAFLTDSLSAGRDVLMDIDVQGAMQIKDRFPEAVTIFIMPPSMGVLRQRLAARGTDSQAVIEKRLKNAVKEMEQKDLYCHVIVNNDLEAAMNELINLVKSYSKTQSKS